jgi:spore cortex formation protein SpoVR/YcgB (stage V sporulation)
MTNNIDDLTVLHNCLTEALVEDFVKITFKDTTKQSIIITCIEDIVDTNQIIEIKDNCILAFDVSAGAWVNIALSDIDVAESVTIFQELQKLDATLE